MDTGMAWTQDGMDTGMARTPQHAGHARPVHDLMHGRAPSACSPLQLTETRAVRVSLAFLNGFLAVEEPALLFNIFKM